MNSNKNRKTIKTDRTDKSANEIEMIRNLNKTAHENRHLRSFRYFTDLVFSWYLTGNQSISREKVIVLGTGIPEELLRAAGAVSFRILGGSHETCAWSDDIMPRDADPVICSIQGYLHRPEQSDFKDTLFIIPLYSDSMRKTAFQLAREGKKVFTLDIPPLRSEKAAFDKWTEQVICMLEAVTEHTRNRITASSLKKEINTTIKARSYMREFMGIMTRFGDNISLSGRILVQNSYYYAEDLSEWAEMLRRLKNEIQVQHRRRDHNTDRQPGILLIGSPVYYPNDKLPALLSASGLRVLRNADASTSIFETVPNIEKCGDNIRKIVEATAEAWYRSDMSSAYVRNNAFRRHVIRLAQTEPVEGIVFHILKGQIDQDFELSFLERTFEEMHIPVFRLETDYQYQDVEQLRIRLEAFSEMLSQKHRTHECKAVSDRSPFAAALSGNTGRIAL